VRGEDDKMNLSMRFREGWEPVKASEHPNFIGAVIEEGRYEGVIGSGGLILCKAPVEMVEERRRYYEGESRAQSEAVDAQIEEHRRAAQAEGMSIQVDKRSRISVGQT
jgi:hypothetical protein